MKRQQVVGVCGCVRWLLVEVSIVWIGLLPSALDALTIARPNFGVPVFAEPGGAFKVEVKDDAGRNPSQWSAVLMNDLQSWAATVEQAEYGTYVDNNTFAGYRLTVRAPAGVSPEVFKLVVSHPNGGAATNRNAVSIVQNLETNFYILHYTDIQVTAMEPTNPDTGEANLNGDIKGSIREIYWHAPAVNLINPRFMFHTGDEKENNWGGETEYELYIEASCSMRTPAFVSRGNNDSTTTTAVWRRQFGVETYSCTIGSFYICMKDFRENNFMPWFSDDYVASFTNSAIKYRLFGQHYNSGGSQWMPPTGQGRDPDLMLVGHGHANSTLQPSYPILETQAAFVRGSVGFFQFNKSADDWACTTLGDPWFQLMSYGATAKIINTLSYANDGTQTTNTATIVNNIPKNFWDGRVRFLMQNAAMGYKVTNGQILAQYAYNSGSNMAVLVKVNIPASGGITVSISKVDANNNGMPDAWETTHFGSTSNPLGAADYDWDHDGQDNLHEYLAGTIPTDPASVFKITSAAMDASGKLVLRWPSVSGKSYRIQASNILLDFQNTADALIAGTGGILTKSLPIGPVLCGFYRIVVIP